MGSEKNQTRVSKSWDIQVQHKAQQKSQQNNTTCWKIKLVICEKIPTRVWIEQFLWIKLNMSYEMIRSYYSVSSHWIT